MKVTVVGCGYVGLVTAAGLAEQGHLVTGVDRDRVKIDKLRHKEVPIYEPDLAELLNRNIKARRLHFTTSLGLGCANSQVIFIAVGTPTRPEGSADLEQVEAVAKEIALYIRDYTVIVNKSTVPVGTGKRVEAIIKEYARGAPTFAVVSNPEFLREGSAVYDFRFPHRIVLGTNSAKALRIMEELYAPFLAANVPFVRTNLETAEMIKYAANAFLATKLSFVNELADLCETVGADLPTVTQGMGLDHRIGSQFLATGPGYGGSCFPKDTKALIHLAHEHGKQVSIVEATVAVNERTKKRMVKKIQKVIGDPAGRIIGLLGLAFKANTDDMRESPAIPIIEGLLAAGARIHAHDPQAMAEAKKIFGERIVYFEDEYEAATGADALVITTEWDVYRRLDLTMLKKLLARTILIDLRNLFDPDQVRAQGFIYEGIGRIDTR